MRGRLFALFRPLLAIALLAFAATAFLQAKGWSYHYYPARATALFLFGVVALGLVAHAESLRQVLKPGAAALPLVTLLLLSVWGFRSFAQAGYAAFGAGRAPKHEPRPVVKQQMLQPDAICPVTEAGS